MDFQLPDPCCGGSLQKGTKIVAIVDLVNAAIGAGTFLLGILLFVVDSSAIQDAAAGDEDMAEVLKLGSGTIVFILLLLLLLNVAYIFLAQTLLHGALERNHRKIELWLGITFGALVIRLVYYLIAIISSSGFLIGPFFATLMLAYQVYAMWVVKAFLDELRRGEESFDIKYQKQIDIFHRQYV